jgi:hypothetical protein
MAQPSDAVMPAAGTLRRLCRLTTILPAMTLAETLDITRIQSVAGLTDARTVQTTIRLCHAPDHISRSDVAVHLQQLHCADLLIDAQNCAGPHPLERHAMGVCGIGSPLPLWLALTIGAVAPLSFSG